MTVEELATRLEDIAGYRDIVLKHRKITDDKKIIYVLKDGTRIHSVIAKLAASLTAALESAAETATQAAARLRELEADNARLRTALKPFADKAEDYRYENPEHHGIVLISDLRRARAALGGKP